MSLMTTKQCRKCEQVLNISLFNKHSGTKDKLDNRCKKCVKLVKIKAQTGETKQKLYTIHELDCDKSGWQVGKYSGTILERTSEQPQDEWTVRGRLSRDDGAEINWREGSIMLHPIGIETTIKDNGEFDITYFLEKGTSFYDKIKYIVYSHEEGNFTFYPKAEHEKYKNNDESTLIEKAGDYYINLKPSSFTPY